MKVIEFTRTIDCVVVAFVLEYELYQKNQKIFNHLFCLYAKKIINEIDIGAKSYYTHYIFEKENEAFCGRSYTRCDCTKKNWIISLMNSIETFLCTIPGITVLHASCFEIQDKGVLLIGSRFSGKTTLTSYFTQRNYNKYLGDDCIYILNNRYYGSGLPLPIRGDVIKEDTKDFGNIVAESIDNELMRRMIYVPQRYTDNLNNINIIILPKFKKCYPLKVAEMKKSEACKAILNNVRAYTDMNDLFRVVNSLSTGTKCYNVEYSICDDVEHWLTEKIINDRSII